jgi:5-methylcytosine-specific restriction endonuclease McrA
MPNIKTGHDHPCVICQKPVYRSPSDVVRNKHLTCGSSECKTQMFRGERNPFWGKTHSQETREQIKATKAANPTLGRTGPPKGYQHTPEAKKKMRDALKLRWLTQRDKMVAALPRGKFHHFHKEPQDRRYRKEFTPVQRREWTGDKCIWCSSTEKLTLDHIIPVFDGGQPVRSNAQTLCHPCNLWKLNFVDRPRYIASLGETVG